MSRSEVDRFIQDVQQGSSPAAVLAAIANDLDQVVEFAHQNGYRFTREEAAEIADVAAELSDEGLEQVAGGDYVFCKTNTLNPTIKCL